MPGKKDSHQAWNRKSWPLFSMRPPTHQVRVGKAEEAQGRLKQDRLTDDQRADRQRRGDRVRDHFSSQDEDLAITEAAHRFDKFQLLPLA